MSPIVFKEFRVVIEQDLDEMLHVNNVVFLQFLQEVAINHWHSVAPTEIIESLRWVVKKHEIEYFNPAQLGDTLELHTWIESIEGVTSRRFYEIYTNNKLVVKANTIWVAVNPITKRPKRLDPSLKSYLFQ